jgi:hypothetical protein
MGAVGVSPSPAPTRTAIDCTTTVSAMPQARRPIRVRIPNRRRVPAPARVDMCKRSGRRQCQCGNARHLFPCRALCCAVSSPGTCRCPRPNEQRRCPMITKTTFASRMPRHPLGRLRNPSPMELSRRHDATGVIPTAARRSRWHAALPWADRGEPRDRSRRSHRVPRVDIGPAGAGREACTTMRAWPPSLAIG